MIKTLTILILTLAYFCPVLASAETPESKKNFVSRSEFRGHNCCQISHIGGWTKYNARKRTPKKEIAVPEGVSENENKVQN